MRGRGKSKIPRDCRKEVNIYINCLIVYSIVIVPPSYTVVSIIFIRCFVRIWWYSFVNPPCHRWTDEPLSTFQHYDNWRLKNCIWLQITSSVNYFYQLLCWRIIFAVHMVQRSSFNWSLSSRWRRGELLRWNESVVWMGFVWRREKKSRIHVICCGIHRDG